ncbi:MAG TPA: hypothetical protein PLJ21_01250 [Pseudobdellovibrionaceae bacterium]|nr:hypothetical protein [Pseudobdellovibrionaceae bacterium]
MNTLKSYLLLTTLLLSIAFGQAFAQSESPIVENNDPDNLEVIETINSEVFIKQIQESSDSEFLELFRSLKDKCSKTSLPKQSENISCNTSIFTVFYMAAIMHFRTLEISLDQVAGTEGDKARNIRDVTLMNLKNICSIDMTVNGKFIENEISTITNANTLCFAKEVRTLLKNLMPLEKIIDNSMKQR